MVSDSKGVMICNFVEYFVLAIVLRDLLDFCSTLRKSLIFDRLRFGRSYDLQFCLCLCICRFFLLVLRDWMDFCSILGESLIFEGLLFRRALVCHMQRIFSQIRTLFYLFCFSSLFHMLI